MAEDFTLDGVPYRKRHPWAPLGLGLVTFGIYMYVWWYKINRELRDYRHGDNEPVVSLMAILFGWIVIVPPFVSVWNTAKRIGEAQEKASGALPRISPPVALLLAIIPIVGLFFGYYLQSQLNEVWDTARGVGPAAGSAPTGPE
ncbi:MAG: DUF4234 domain-containing protein [Acidimicrobiia bacterium]|nr:DUF4234 domain-containing protein [Acidimicrobiia bacterium]